MDRDQVSAIFDRAAGTYDAGANAFFTPFGEALVRFAEIGPAHRVLDAGCGTGAVLVPAAQAAGMAVGVELSPAMAERARQAAPSADVVVADASSLPFEDGSFNVVLAGFVVFFIPDATAALREWGRVLVPGGRLAISSWGSPDPRWAFEREIRRGFLAELDPAVLKQLGEEHALLERFAELGKVRTELEKAGFKVTRQQEHPIEFVFSDVQSWWNWNWSHAGRVVLEALPEAARERLLAEMAEGMEQVRESRGCPRTFTGLFTEGTID